MIWITLACLIGIITFFQLGTMSVWMIVMAQTIKVLLFVLTGGLLYVLCRYLKSRKQMKTHMETEIRRIA
jgi:hypothetical protein